MKIKKNKAFTLVELIVVITILAILGTIAFISLQGYSSSARDSRRISDVGNIKTALELFVLDTGDYPLPDNPGTVYYSGDLLWTQGTIGENVVVNLGKTLPTKPLDPLFDIEYTYSVTSNRNEYQLMSLYENTISQINTLINTSYAADVLTPKVEGTYNELFIETPSFIVPTPSIITSETLTGTALNIYTNTGAINSMIVTGGTNFPDLGIPNTTQKTGELIVNLSVYTGSLTSSSTTAEKQAAITKIQDAYAGTTLSTKSIYANVINTTDPVILADRLILSNYTSATTAFTCPAGYEGNGKQMNDINSENPVISPDGNWIVYLNRNDEIGMENLYKLSMNNTDISNSGVQITTEGAEPQPSYSADGNYILFSRNGEIYKKNANDDGDEGIHIMTGVTDARQTQYSFDSNSRYIVYNSNNDDSTKIIDTTIGDSTGELLSIHGGQPQFSPDGKYVVTNSRDETYGSSLWKIDVQTKEETRILDRGNQPIYSPDGKWILYSGDGGLFRIPSDNTDVENPGERITNNPNVSQSTYSHDGNWIVYTTSGGNYDVLYKKCANY